MGLLKRKIPREEKRQYVRINTVLPVEFKLIAREDGREKSDWLQGFTRNLSKAGICLTTNNLDPQYADLIIRKEVNLFLRIDIPFMRYHADASANVIWIKLEEKAPFNQYRIGLQYEKIDALANKRIMRFVYLRKYMLRLLIAGLIALLLGIIFNSYLNMLLLKINKTLTNELVNIIQRSSIAKQDMSRIFDEKYTLTLRLSENRIRIQNAQMIPDKQKREELLEALLKERESWEKEFNKLDKKGINLTEDLLMMSRHEADLESVSLDKIYNCIESNQSPSTGLIASFIGDEQFDGIGFTYDQALAILTFTYLSDFRRGGDILRFYSNRAKKLNGNFLNAYYVSDGSVANYSVNQAANIMLGIAISQYTRHTYDRRYIGIAEDIARRISLSENKISTLDAYALFNLLYKVTGEDIYLKLKDEIFKKWKNNFLNYKQPTFNDYMLPLLVLGPEKLYAEGINSDVLIKKLERNFSTRSSHLGLRGFGKEGAVSCEWTDQMVIAYKTMADYYFKHQIPAKQRAFSDKANEYLSQMTKLLIFDLADHRQNCLYYSEDDYVDTGHGFRTPRGKNIASLAATCYTLFAYYGYNPYKH